MTGQTLPEAPPVGPPPGGPSYVRCLNLDGDGVGWKYPIIVRSGEIGGCGLPRNFAIATPLPAGDWEEQIVEAVSVFDRAEVALLRGREDLAIPRSRCGLAARETVRLK